MSIPFSYAIGLAVVLLARELLHILPGSGNALVAIAGMLLLALPALFEWFAAKRARRFGAGDRTARIAGRIAVASLPACYLCVLGPCGWLDVLDRWSGESELAAALLLLAPLFTAEILRLWVEVATAPMDDVVAVRIHARSRLAFVCVFTLPWFVLGVGADLLATQRAVYGFLVGTGAGLTLGAIALVVGMGFALPLALRFLFGLRSDLPAAIADDLRRTAGALGFPGRAVLWLDSGMRHVNALLLGPLPWPRYLVLTDGLMAALDVGSLRGVVAHEVGHAQAGHPALLLALFVVTPMLLFNTAQPLESAQIGTVGGVAMAVAVALLVWWLLRRVSHRFEHEADVLSALALGGAEPCISALQRVGQVVQQEPDRASMLHPSENARVALLRRFAGDPEFRARFTLRGLRLRYAIATAVLFGLLAAGWNWYRSWPLERAALSCMVGDFAGARQQVERVGNDVPSGQWEWWTDFREELECSIAIVGDGGEWELVRDRLRDGARTRGVEVLIRDGAKMARPWFAIAVDAGAREPVARSLLRYCRAARDNDVDEMLRLAAHLRWLGCSPDIDAVLVR